jgi:hypothetical protein
LVPPADDGLVLHDLALLKQNKIVVDLPASSSVTPFRTPDGKSEHDLPAVSETRKIEESINPMQYNAPLDRQCSKQALLNK